MAERPNGAGTEGVDTRLSPLHRCCVNPSYRRLLYTPRRALPQRQASFSHVNQDVYGILWYLVTDKAAALLVTIYAYIEGGTRGDCRKKME